MMMSESSILAEKEALQEQEKEMLQEQEQEGEGTQISVQFVSETGESPFPPFEVCTVTSNNICFICSESLHSFSSIMSTSNLVQINTIIKH